LALTKALFEARRASSPKVRKPILLYPQRGRLAGGFGYFRQDESNRDLSVAETLETKKKHFLFLSGFPPTRE